MSQPATPKELGEKIREARRAAPLTEEEIARRTPRQTGPLTQEELAARMGIARDAVNKLERGGAVGPKNAERLARALGGSPSDWLLKRSTLDAETRAQLEREMDELRKRVAELESRLDAAAG